MEKVFSLLYDKQLLPLSNQELENQHELRSTFRALKVVEATDVLPSEMEWLNNIKRLRELVLAHDPREFLRWDVIANTMFVANAKYISTELKYLKNHSNWRRWQMALKESPAGRPIPYPTCPFTSGNLIHHTYHVAQFEEKTKLQVQNLDYVFEFGGGYGNMCRLFFNLGFKGKYIIFDLPPFSALQKYYLKTVGVPIHSIETFDKSKVGTICLSDLQQLVTILTHHIDGINSLFIATWSISETPIDIRNSILPLTSTFKSFLIAYQDKFGEVDNLAFFNKWRNICNNVNWNCWPIEHITGNNYLIGYRK